MGGTAVVAPQKTGGGNLGTLPGPLPALPALPSCSP